MTVYEQTDGFVPNKQTPPTTSKLGASDARFTEVHGTTVSGTTVGAGSNLYVAGRSVPGIYTETVDLEAATAYTVTHGLNNSTPIVQVYGSGTNEQYLSGSGVGTVITAVSGSSANAVDITVSAAAPGSTVVIIG
jgi:hypothetical protein